MTGPAPHLCNVGVAWCTPVPYVPGREGGDPVLAPLTVEWHRAEKNIAMPTNFNRIQVVKDGMEIGDARQSAIEDCMRHRPRPEFIFFLDFDVIPNWDCLTKLLYRARHFPDYDIFAGVYCLKSSVCEPLIYKDWGQGPFWDWAVGDLLLEGITGVHMGCTLIRMSLFDRLDYIGTPAFKTENYHFVKDGAVHSNRGTEDLFFCKRAVEEAKAKILVDTSVLCGHQDFGSRRVYGLPMDCGPVKRAIWMKHGVKPDVEEKLALDLGAGDLKRTWPGYKVFTTDIRPDVGADYVQDTRYLNFPDEHWDLIASSHHLEHIPRWYQEEVWQQMFRLLKPGGTIEHYVPSLEWAAGNIQEGNVDEHVYNVLYGAQEAHGYRREYNLHYFGFTKDVARGLCEQAGFVDVDLKDWRDDPDLNYNLLIKARKPISGEVPCPKDQKTESVLSSCTAAPPSPSVPAKQGSTKSPRSTRRLSKILEKTLSSTSDRTTSMRRRSKRGSSVTLSNGKHRSRKS